MMLSLQAEELSKRDPNIIEMYDPIKQALLSPNPAYVDQHSVRSICCYLTMLGSTTTSFTRRPARAHGRWRTSVLG